ncbi:hypothetical protein KFL_002750020 [Klebsormidium nitens]|uniref:Uncharacterized protein n=1 Tax=Klebsormidium nitens TaxID=105231 RepID=A0A1Y1I5F7_KLENI|nr:hypothetical protein KFL_002750020 [Klebsormidium nitens]|eukprot:GAQ86185.1 hypothetical protein KFL_002750020 [Klebsormidium nitens]
MMEATATSSLTGVHSLAAAAVSCSRPSTSYSHLAPLPTPSQPFHSFLPATFRHPSFSGLPHPRQQRSFRCAANAESDEPRYPNIPRLRDWAEGDGTRRLAAWEEAEVPIPGHYQAEVAERDTVLDNARQFKTLQDQATMDGNNYTVIRHLGQRADRDQYNYLPERLRYGPQPYMAATDEYEELMANKLVEVEPVFKEEAMYRTAVARWLGQPSGREKRLRRYRARRAQVEAGQKGSV